MATSRKCFDVKVSLIGVEPVVWRTIGVPADYTLHDFHDIVQIAMGWHFYHAYCFVIAGQEYSSTRGLEGVSRQKLSLSTAFKRSPEGFEYRYDFGDGWRHKVELVGSQKVANDDPPPMCWDGAMACPPEDVGGPGGYAQFRAAIADPSHEEHESYLEWIGGKFDPACFSHRQATAGLIAWRRQKSMLELAISGIAERIFNAQ